jgi:ribonucleotide monophosphatase NagD (HAD superfamily)
MQLSYAQNLEDYHLDLVFAGQDAGTYVDVGGGHPVADNVSFWFYLKGWRGLIVEPQRALAEAEAIVCTGLRNDRSETVEDYRGLIEEGVALGVPFVCANPDLVVDVGALRLPCAGAIAAEYERRGGEVFWAGKPHPSAYATALERAAELRGGKPELARILGIGDAVRTDLASARGLGVDALLIAAGIHSEDLLADGAIEPSRLAALFAQPDTPPAVGAMTHLRW